MRVHNLTDRISIRVSKKLRNQFYQKAARFGQPTDILRQILTAFVEDRIKIIKKDPDEESLYVTGN